MAEKSTEHKEQYILQTLDNALTLLNLFEARDTLTLTEAAESLHCGKTIAFRLLYTLEARGFLHKQEDGHYMLGMRMEALGSRVQFENAVLPLMHPYLQALSTRVNDTVHLVIWHDVASVKLLNEILPNQRLMAVGQKFDTRAPHLTSTGMALLSTRSDAEILAYAQNTMFEKKTENSISSIAQLMNDIIEVRKLGYAVNNQFYETGICSIAMAIVTDTAKCAQYAVSVSGPAMRIEENKELILAALHDTVEGLKKLPL